MSVLARLSQAGLTLPKPAQPGGAYRPTESAGSLLFVSAQFPIINGELKYQGRIGAELTVEQGYDAARLAALNVLSQIEHALDGFERLDHIVRLDGHMQTTSDFQHHAQVLDGASDLFHLALAERAGHARSIFGQHTLPLNLPVELVVIAAMRRE